MNTGRRLKLLGVWVVLAAIALSLSGCSSPMTFDQLGARRGTDIVLAAFQPDANGQGPVLKACPFGNMTTIASDLGKASGVAVGKLGEPVDQISPWSNATDTGRTINCGATSAGFAFNVGVQRGKQDEHPPAGAAWKGPSSYGGGKVYYSSIASSKLCSVVWARSGTFLTVGVQIAQVALTESHCIAAGKQGIAVVLNALAATEPFNVVAPSSSTPAAPSSS